MRTPPSQAAGRQRLLTLAAAVLVAVAMIRVALPRVNAWTGPLRIERDALRATVASLKDIDLSQFRALREAAARDQAALAAAEDGLSTEHDVGALLRVLGQHAQASGVTLGIIRPAEATAAAVARLRPYGVSAYAVSVTGGWAGVHGFVRRVASAERFVLPSIERVGRDGLSGQLTADLMLTVVSRSEGAAPVPMVSAAPVIPLGTEAASLTPASAPEGGLQ